MKFLALVVAVLALNACALFAPSAPPPPERLRLVSSSFDSLPGWEFDSVAEAIPAFQKSCAVLLRKPPESAVGSFGRAKDWRAPCAALQAAIPTTDAAARAYFARYFKPYEARGNTSGLFTGYYEATLNGSWTRGGKYQTPLWQKPKDLLSADLGDFRDDLKGRKLVGKVDGQSFKPYDDRAAVAKNSLQGRAEPLLWADDAVSAFFLEIQGSGRVKMSDGSMIRIGYDAQNGHPFVPIGRVLADEGGVAKPVTMKKIRDWLESHPTKAQGMMNKNPSVVFFRKTNADGAVGAQGVVLTPMRSMAVDPSFVPLGTPLFVSMDNRASGGNPRLVIAQDTGGAIKGAVRGDLFTGVGGDAESFAGNLQSSGTYYLLLPRDLDVRSE
jgi:membrane-bound lytic murein transglycosylase A